MESIFLAIESQSNISTYFYLDIFMGVQRKYFDYKGRSLSTYINFFFFSRLAIGCREKEMLTNNSLNFYTVKTHWLTFKYRAILCACQKCHNINERHYFLFMVLPIYFFICMNSFLMQRQNRKNLPCINDMIYFKIHDFLKLE